MWIWIFLAYVLIINLIAFFTYKGDKHLAEKNGTSNQKHRRVPEKRLLLLAWLGGGIGAWVAMRRYRHKTQHRAFRILVPLACIIWLVPELDMVTVIATSVGRVWFTPLMIRRAWEATADTDKSKSYTYQYNWVSYDQISPTLTRAVIASEDNLFQTHNGFSQRGIDKAIKEYKTKGTVKHGGSTISQQTAKNMFTFGYRNIWRKGREAWMTILIEQIWTKRRIMEVYLNVIEMGSGIYGAEAASQAYYHHSAKQLTAAESATIAAILPRPQKYSVVHPGPYVQRRKEQILWLMPKMGRIDLNDPKKQ